MSAAQFFLSIGCMLVYANAFLLGQSYKPKQVAPAFESLATAPLLFEENRGQFADEYGNARGDVLYALRSGAVTLYLTRRGIEYVFARIENPPPAVSEATGRSTIHPISGRRGVENARISYYRVDMRFDGAMHDVQVLPQEETSYTVNYYTTDFPNGLEHVRTFRRILYTNIYPCIDMIIQAEEHGIEYSYIVHPGGDASNIRISYPGATSIHTRSDGSLVASTPHGEFHTSRMIAYQETESGRETIAAQVLSNDVGSMISIGKHDVQRDLILDPHVVWSTYYGGSEQDGFTAIRIDAHDNIYACGFTGSISAIATQGAFQSQFNGGHQDALVVKLDSAGKRLWGTYVGGDGSYEYLVGLDTVRSGIVCVGETDANGLATAGVHQAIKGGEEDAIIILLSPDGQRRWATYFGGDASEGVNAVVTDAEGNIYVAGHTASSDGIATVGTHSQTWAGWSDAFLAKFSGAGGLLWGTYYGGSESDGSTDIALTAGGDIAICGITESRSGIATPGAFLQNWQGDFDVFLAKFSGAGSLLWGTYYGGRFHDGWDGVSTVGMCSSAEGNLLLTGTTWSPTGLSSPGAYQTDNNGYYDGFIAKFDLAGARLWGTYIGSDKDTLFPGTTGDHADGIIGISVDSEGYIIIAGESNGPGLASSGGVHQSTLLGGTNVFLMKMSPDGQRRIWGTYFGGKGVTDYRIRGKRPLAIDPQDNIYVCGHTNSGDHIATLTAHQTVYGGGYEDGFLAKFSKERSSIALHPIASHFCAGDTVLIGYSYTGVLDNKGFFVAQLSDSSGSFVSPVELGRVSGQSPNPIFAIIPDYTTYGTNYRIRIVATVPGIADTSYGFITIFAKPVAHIQSTGPLVFCEGGSTVLRADTAAGCVYSWVRNGIGPIGTSPELIATESGLYQVIVTNADGCSALSQAMEIRVSRPAPVIAGPSVICAGDTTWLDAGSDYAACEWRDENGVIIGIGRRLAASRAGEYRVFVTDSYGCTGTSAVHTLFLHPAAAKPVIVPQGDSLVSSTAATYQWLLNGEPLSGVTSRVIVPMTDGYYSVRITDANGCIAFSDAVIITVAKEIFTTVEVPILAAAPGERVALPIRLVSQSHIAILSPREFTAELRFDSHVLYPAENTPMGSIQGRERVIPIRGVYQNMETALAEIVLIATLGDTDRTALRLTNFEWADSRAYVTVYDGEFHLNICREGGSRLFDGSATFHLAVHPNPFNASTVIDYTTIEKGHVKLFVVDALGRRAAMIYDAHQEVGPHSIVYDASSLPSGMYLLVAQTETMLESTRFTILK